MTPTQHRAPATDEALATDQITADFWTDPLCCWSYALHAHWRKVREESVTPIVCRYRMGGMIAGWDDYADPVQSISRPIQMGPVMLQVRHLTDIEIDDRIWVDNPPASSYPACVAVKAAELQSPAIAEEYLQRIWRAVMAQNRNISRERVLLELAGELRQAGLEFDRFANEWSGEQAVQAFREDLQEAHYRNIGRFPTLILNRRGHAGVILVGYRPYDDLKKLVDMYAKSPTPL